MPWITDEELNAGLPLKVIGKGKVVGGRFAFDQPVADDAVLPTDRVVVIDGRNGTFLARAFRLAEAVPETLPVYSRKEEA